MRFIRDQKKIKRLQNQISVNVIGILNGVLLDEKSYITLTGNPDELVELERILNESPLTDIKFYASRMVYKSKLDKSRVAKKKEFKI